VIAIFIKYTINRIEYQQKTMKNARNISFSIEYRYIMPVLSESIYIQKKK